MTTIKTRKEYLDDKISHHDYYMQFATEAMKRQVIRDITVEAIKNSKDEHLNDIPLHRWDLLSGCMFRGSMMMVRPTVEKECREKIDLAGEGVSPATLVCIYKAIAKELKNN